MTDLEKAQLETQFWKLGQEEAAIARDAALTRIDALEDENKTLEVRLADATRMYELVASSRTKELVDAANARADAAETRIKEMEQLLNTSVRNTNASIDNTNDALMRWQKAEAEAGRLRTALEAIAAWPFDVMGDCVADARKLAAAALLPVEKEGE